jgi:hypothetical protein
VGLGAFGVKRIKGSPQKLRDMIIKNASILLMGIILLAIFSLGAKYSQGLTITMLDVSNSFYSVLFYYFFAVITIPIFIFHLAKTNHFVMYASFVTVTCYFIHVLFDGIDITPSTNPLIQILILLVKSKYNYFEMTAGVMLGVLIGYQGIAQANFNKINIRGLAVVLVLCSIILSLENENAYKWIIWPTAELELWMWLFYAAVILLAYQFLLQILMKSLVQKSLVNKLFKFLSICGVLAFPLFVGHKLVMPFKDLLEASGWSYPIVIPMVLFFGIAGFYSRKIYNLI